MSSTRHLINAHMAALIDGPFGCLDSAAETINARLGLSVCKGTLSKRLSGQYGWPADEIFALEDAAGRYPVTRTAARRLHGDENTARGSIIIQAGIISKEVGEAVNALLAADQNANSENWADAVHEIDEGIEALRRARSLAEKRMVDAA
jgi:hypothetical protein